MKMGSDDLNLMKHFSELLRGSAHEHQTNPVSFGVQNWFSLNSYSGKAVFSRGTAKASLEKIELGAALHLSLEELELGYRAFGLSVGPGFDDGGGNRSVVRLEPG
jgi:hypothetical protein